MSALTLQADGNLLVAAANGLFVSAGGSLQLSPLSGAVPSGALISNMSAFGSGSAEQLWFVSGSTLGLISDGSSQIVSLPNTSLPQVVVAISRNVAVVVADARLVSIDLNLQLSLVLAEDVGNASGATIDSLGTAWFATDSGLLSVNSAADFVQTLSGSATPERVCGVAAAASGVDAEAGGDLLQALRTDGVFVSASILSLAGEAPIGVCPIAVDSQGGVYLDDGMGFAYFAKPNSISFASQVEPILSLNCAVCHKPPGVNGAPAIDFTQYSVALSYCGQMTQAIQGAPGQAMPPPPNDALTASDISLIDGWCSNPSP